MLGRVFIFASLAIFSTSALYYHIADTEKKCFIEKIPDETRVSGNFKVQLYDPNTKGYRDNRNIGMHIEIKDPEKKVILSKLYTSEGRFTFTSHTPGEHLICLYSNSTGWFASGQYRVYLDIQAGEHTINYEELNLSLLEKVSDQLWNEAPIYVKLPVSIACFIIACFICNTCLKNIAKNRDFKQKGWNKVRLLNIV